MEKHPLQDEAEAAVDALERTMREPDYLSEILLMTAEFSQNHDPESPTGKEFAEIADLACRAIEQREADRG